MVGLTKGLSYSTEQLWTEIARLQQLGIDLTAERDDEQAATQLMQKDRDHWLERAKAAEAERDAALEERDRMKAEKIIAEVGCRRVRHVRRGTAYSVVCQASLQTSCILRDMDQMVVYQGDDGVLWVRPLSEFEDGRFEPIINQQKGDAG